MTNAILTRFFRRTPQGPVEVTEAEYTQAPTQHVRVEIGRPVQRVSRDALGRLVITIVRLAVSSAYDGLTNTMGEGPSHRWAVTEIEMNPLIEFFPDGRKTEAWLDLASGMTREDWGRKYFRELNETRISAVHVYV